MESSRIQRLAYFLIFIVFGAVVLKEGAFLLVPLVWGVFFAFALNPIVNWFELKRIPRGIAFGKSLLSVTLIAVGIIYLFVNQMIGLLDEIPQIQNTLETKLKSLFLELNQLIGSDSIDLENLSLFNLLNTENFNTTFFPNRKIFGSAWDNCSTHFFINLSQGLFVEFILKLYENSNERVLTWARDSG